MAMQPVIGGRYALQRRLGNGSQGEVYQALDTHEGDLVALKLLTVVPLGGHWQEAQILRRLADPHILPIRNADVASGRPYLVTDLATYGTLDAHVAASGSCGLLIDDVVRWTMQACLGVARGHDLRLLHNDVKPGNLFMNAQGECLVGDFGFATLLQPGQATARPQGATAETVAPEVAAAWATPATEAASVLSDVFSLGATAYWQLAARPPLDLSGASGTPARMAVAATAVPARLRGLAPHVPQGIARVIERAMSRNPADRFPTPTAFAAALGARSAVTRRWLRTDEHPGHLGCWRGEEAGGGAYLLCLEHGGRAGQCQVTATHASSGRRITRGCRTARARTWAAAVRGAILALG